MQQATLSIPPVPAYSISVSFCYECPSSTMLKLENYTHTLLAHLVTLLPSFMQSISPFPGLSFLHCIKSSLYALHRAPMKKLAESRGAELAPISFTGGISAGNGVVSIKVCWLNLEPKLARVLPIRLRSLPGRTSRHLDQLLRGTLFSRNPIESYGRRAELDVRSGTLCGNCRIEICVDARQPKIEALSQQQVQKAI